MKKVGTRAGSTTSSPSSIHASKPGQRAAHRAWPDRPPDRHSGEVAGLGLAVAVVDRHPDRLPPRHDHLRVERLPGGDGVAQRGQLPQLAALADRAVLGGRHAEHVHALALEQVEPLRRVEAGVVQQRRGTAQPGGDEGVASRQRPAACGGAPAQVTGAGVVPMLGLDELAGQVAGSVADRLGLAGRPRREHDQRRVVGLELGRRSGLGLEQAVVGRRPAPARRSPRPRRARRCGRPRPSRPGRPPPCVAAGRRGAAARCTAAPRRRGASRPPSRRPTRAGCRPASSRRSRARRRGQPACPPAAPSGPPPRRRLISRRSPSRVTATSARRRGSATSTTSLAKFTERRPSSARPG